MLNPRPSVSSQSAPHVVQGLSRRHLEALARDLRPSDRTEVAAWGLEPLRALELSANASTEVYTVLSGDRVVMAFGVGPKPLDGEPAYGIWMLSTPLLEDFPRQVAREARGWIDRFKGRYGTLWNIAHAGNELHVRWIDWLGFSIGSSALGARWIKFVSRES
jgi:hypothetical protein